MIAPRSKGNANKTSSIPVRPHKVDKKIILLIEDSKTFREFNFILQTLIFSYHIPEHQVSIPSDFKNKEFMNSLITILGCSAIKMEIYQKIFLHYQKLKAQEKLIEDEMRLIIREFASRTISPPYIQFMAEFYKIKLSDFNDMIKQVREGTGENGCNSNEKKLDKLEEKKKNANEKIMAAKGKIVDVNINTQSPSQPSRNVRKKKRKNLFANYTKCFCEAKTLIEGEAVLLPLFEQLNIGILDIEIPSSYKYPNLISYILSLFGNKVGLLKDTKEIFLHYQTLKLQEKIVEDEKSLILQVAARTKLGIKTLRFFSDFYKTSIDFIKSEALKIQATLPQHKKKFSKQIPALTEENANVNIKNVSNIIPIEKPQENEKIIIDEKKAHEMLADLIKSQDFLGIAKILNKYQNFVNEADLKISLHALIFSCELESLKNLCENSPKIKNCLFEQIGSPVLDNFKVNNKGKSKKSKDNIVDKIIDYEPLFIKPFRMG